MLRKKEWLRLWENKMLASGYFDRFMVSIFADGINHDRVQELSPGESANEHIEFWEDRQYADKSGG
jgi:hypothetical protein